MELALAAAVNGGINDKACIDNDHKIPYSYLYFHNVIVYTAPMSALCCQKII